MYTNFDSFSLFDLLNTTISQTQNYSALYDFRNTLLPYSLHLLLAFDPNKHQNIKFLYPANYYQVFTIQIHKLIFLLE